jgi:uncharacterized protein GlcG (DUF336 family)
MGLVRGLTDLDTMDWSGFRKNLTFDQGAKSNKKENVIIGAIGVSGSSVENDHEVASTGAEASLNK